MKSYNEIAGDGGSNIDSQVAERTDRLSSRLSSIRSIIAVMSGKGGVGKSSTTVNFAAALALQNYSVGIIDADINSPTIAKMTGVKGHILESGKTGLKPALSDLNIKIMSMDLFHSEEHTPVLWKAPTQRDSYTWRGMMETAALQEFLADTEWGVLDFLFIDLPPGNDNLQTIIDLLPNVCGTIVVTISSAVSSFIVSKSLRMASEVLKTPLIGLVENMSTYCCNHCGNVESLFPQSDIKELTSNLNVPLLGSIPFDPKIAIAADEGKLFMTTYDESPAGKIIKDITRQIVHFAQA